VLDARRAAEAEPEYPPPPEFFIRLADTRGPGGPSRAEQKYIADIKRASDEQLRARLLDIEARNADEREAAAMAVDGTRRRRARARGFGLADFKGAERFTAGDYGGSSGGENSYSDDDDGEGSYGLGLLRGPRGPNGEVKWVRGQGDKKMMKHLEKAVRLGARIKRREAREALDSEDRESTDFQDSDARGGRSEEEREENDAWDNFRSRRD